MSKPARGPRTVPATNVPAAMDAADWPRQAARFSAASAFACFALNCVVFQLMLKNPQPGREWVWMATNGVSVGIIGLGILSGLFGLAGGIRRKSGDTIGIALIGLVLHGGILFVALWLRAALRTAH